MNELRLAELRCVELRAIELRFVELRLGAAGQEWRLVKLRQGMMSREMWTFFFIEASCQRSPIIETKH